MDMMDTMSKSLNSFLMPFLWLLLVFIVPETEAGEYCATNWPSYEYCSYGCCGAFNHECCSYPVGNIVGIVIGGAIVFGIVVLIIICCTAKSCPLYQTTHRGTVVSTGGHQTVTTTTVQRPVGQTMVATTHTPVQPAVHYGPTNPSNPPGVAFQSNQYYPPPTAYAQPAFQPAQQPAFQPAQQPGYQPAYPPPPTYSAQPATPQPPQQQNPPAAPGGAQEMTPTGEMKY